MITTPKQLLDALNRRDPETPIKISPVVIDKTGEYFCTAVYTANFGVVLSIDVNEDGEFIKDTVGSLAAAISRNIKEKLIADGSIQLAYCAVNGALRILPVRAILNRGKLKLVKLTETHSGCADTEKDG
jgi:hypothetical protein